jgi:hypothetical protein
VCSSAIVDLWEWRSPCGVSPMAIGSHDASARLWAPRPRIGRPGNGSAVTGTGRLGCGAFGGKQPSAAGLKIQVANPLRRQ